MELRVGLVPDGVRQLCRAGHEVRIETGAGAGCGLEDAAYAKAGARIVGVEEGWGSDLVVKVKEPQLEEIVRIGGWCEVIEEVRDREGNEQDAGVVGVVELAI